MAIIPFSFQQPEGKLYPKLGAFCRFSCKYATNQVNLVLEYRIKGIINSILMIELTKITKIKLINPDSPLRNSEFLTFSLLHYSIIL